MEAWIGLTGVLIGTILGGVLSIVVGRYQAQDADRRLSVQLEHADQQRERDRRIAIGNESADHLGTLIQTLSETLPTYTKDSSIKEMDEMVFMRWSSANQRALVAMNAIGDNDALDAVRTVNLLTINLFNAEYTDAAMEHLSQVTKALAVLDQHYIRLKLGDSQQTKP